jgi:methylenetetrahydrofolate dehydrogenase (NADP+)/methenyltetrahydrofolate cyclohydrolase
MITGDMIKPGAVVIDVGMNRVPSGPRAGKLWAMSTSTRAVARAPSLRCQAEWAR